MSGLRPLGVLTAMLFRDPLEIPLGDWEAALTPGYRFDYAEGCIRVTVEVLRIVRGPLVELELRVVDDTYSRPEAPRRGDTFVASYRADVGPFYVWTPRTEGHFARFAAWEMDQAAND